MKTRPPQTSKSLTQEGLRRLLETLDADPDRAAVRYEELRHGLQALFRFWGAIAGLELADLTLDRVALKIEEGTSIAGESVGRYARAVARMIFHERQREFDREQRTLTEFQRTNASEDDAHERVLAALDQCLETLPSDDRRLLLDYYDVHGPTASQVRQRLAVRIGTSWTALRIRVLRLRQRLEACVGAALKQ